MRHILRLVVVFCFANSCAAEKVVPRIALIASRDEKAGTLVSLMEVDLSRRDDVVLLDRSDINKIVDEQDIMMSFGAISASERRKLGKLLNADTLVFLSAQENKDKAYVKVVMSDCAYGARLNTSTFPYEENQVEHMAHSISDSIMEAQGRFAGGVKHIIGVSHFVSKDLLHDYDNFQSSFAYVLENALLSYPGIAVLETEEALALSKDLDRDDDKLTGRIMPIFVEGEYRVSNNGESEQIALSICITSMRNNEQPEKLLRESLSLEAASEFLKNDVPVFLLKDLDGARVGGLSLEQQFKLLAERADDFAQLGFCEQSIGLREAAVLINPDDVGQRVKLIGEYGADKWRIALDHFEYLVRNKLIDIDSGVSLNSSIIRKGFACFRGDPRREGVDRERETYRKIARYHYMYVYPLLLDAKGSKATHGEYNRWARDLFKYMVKTAGEQDLDFVLEVMCDVNPGGRAPVDDFVYFLETSPMDVKRRVERPGFSEQSYLDFLERLQKSDKELNKLYARYGFLAYQAFADVSKGTPETEDMLREAESILNDLGRYRQAHSLSSNDGSVLDDKVKFIRQRCLRALGRSNSPIIRTEPHSHVFSKGRLSFDEITFEVKELSGKVHPLKNTSWPVYYGTSCIRNVTRCTESLEVFWNTGMISFHKKPGLLEVVVADKTPVFTDVKWDGKNIWVGTEQQGLWVISSSGDIIARIQKSDGLPPSDGGMVLYPISEDKVLAVGSFGRSWCAIVSLSGHDPSVNVFHEATLLKASDTSQSTDEQVQLTFTPEQIRPHYLEDKKDIVLVGRKRGPHFMPPLEVNVRSLDVSVHQYNFNPEYKCGDRYFDASEFCVTELATPEARLNDGKAWRHMCRNKYNAGLLEGLLIPYEKWIYAPGRTWFRFDPATLKEERLVPEYLPQEYVYEHYAVSQHFGLIAWNHDSIIFRIAVKDVESVDQ